MTTRSIVLLALLAGCGKSSSKTDHAAPTPSGSAAGSGSAAPVPAPVAAPAATALAECPTGDALTAKIAELYKTKADAISNAGCAAGKFPAPGWWVTAYVATGDTTFERSAVIDAKGTIVPTAEDEIPPALIDYSGSGNHRAVDFDKDGTDEILYTYRRIRRGYAESSLYVGKLVSGKWEVALARGFSYDSSDAVENESEVERCDATWEIDANLAIVFTPKGKIKSTDESTCVLAKEMWTLGADGKFAKLAAPAKAKAKAKG